MLASSLQKMLDENGIKYFTVRHNPAFTAQEVAPLRTFRATASPRRWLRRLMVPWRLLSCTTHRALWTPSSG